MQNIGTDLLLPLYIKVKKTIYRQKQADLFFKIALQKKKEIMDFIEEKTKNKRNYLLTYTFDGHLLFIKFY